MILLIDNYDSFVYNLQRYFVRLGQDVCVVRNDAPSLGEMLRLVRQQVPNPFAHWSVADSLPAHRSPAHRSSASSSTHRAPEPTAIVISPGPKRPCDAGYCIEAVRTLSGRLPILGVCLGHQVIYEAFGGLVVRASVPVHGRSSPMRLQTSPLFAGLPQGNGATEVDFARYHSLVAQPQSLPAELRIIAHADDGHVMAVQHRHHATYGVQFHPESILSPAGYRVLHNFLRIAGLPVTDELPPADWTPRPAAATEPQIASAYFNPAAYNPAAGNPAAGSPATDSQSSHSQAPHRRSSSGPDEAGPFASLPTMGTH